MVQVESLGELGVFFTLFVVGLEFSPERLRKVNKRDLSLGQKLIDERLFLQVLDCKAIQYACYRCNVILCFILATLPFLRK